MSPTLLQTSGNRDALVAHIRKDVDCIHNLVLYYQMETRSSLRAVMLQIFAALCTMSAAFITTLLYSVLTLELVRDLMSTEGLSTPGLLKGIPNFQNLFFLNNPKLPICVTQKVLS